MVENGLVSIMKNKYNNNDKLNIMTQFIVDNIEKAITWDYLEATLNFNKKYLNQINQPNHPSQKDWKIFFDDDDVNNYLQAETLKNKRVTIRKIINQLDENKKLSQQEIKAIETLSALITNNNSKDNNIQYIQYNSGFRFDEYSDNIIETTPKFNED